MLTDAEKKEKEQAKLRKERYNANKKQLQTEQVAVENSEDLSPDTARKQREEARDLSPATLKKREKARESSRLYRLRKKEKGKENPKSLCHSISNKVAVNDDLSVDCLSADCAAEDEKMDCEIINLASPTVSVVKRNGLPITTLLRKRASTAPTSTSTPRVVKRGTRALNSTSPTEGNTVDLLDCSPGVSTKGRVVRLQIGKHSRIENEMTADWALESVSDIRQRFLVSLPFQEITTNLLATLESLKRPKQQRIISPKPEHAVRLLLLLGPDENIRESIECSMDAQDIYVLLKGRSFVNDATLNYYRCLLIKEEMNRALRYHSSEWVPSWIHSTFFMQLLMLHGYGAVQDADRQFIGKGKEKETKDK